jgi:hypothetical protein
MSESSPESKMDDSFETKHRKDKTREGYLYVVLGVIFLVWTAFDVAFDVP